MGFVKQGGQQEKRPYLGVNLAKVRCRFSKRSLGYKYPRCRYQYLQHLQTFRTKLASSEHANKLHKISRNVLKAGLIASLRIDSWCATHAGDRGCHTPYSPRAR